MHSNCPCDAAASAGLPDLDWRSILRQLGMLIAGPAVRLHGWRNLQARALESALRHTGSRCRRQEVRDE